MTVLLECKDITKEYGDKLILDKISLKIKYGEKVALVGTNGTGKTTLANIIYGNYDMLILDEPTNHLDYLGVSWLIKNISKFKGTVLIISHDRYFLDKTVNHIIEIEDKKLVSYNGNYTWYREKKKNYEDNLHKYIEQGKVESKINKQIDELKRWSEKAHRDSTKKALTAGCKMGIKEHFRAKAKKKDQLVKSRIKKLEKLKREGVTKPKEEEQIIFHIDKANKAGTIIARADNISKTLGGKVIFENSSFYIKRNEKIGLYGVNGCGKTTLIKGLLGELDVEGDLYINGGNNIGYISQEVIGLDEESEILDLFSANDRQELGDIITKLDLLGFPKDSLNKKVKVLSLGERMKLKILLMMNSNCDILILDEPTNHIDLHVREQLEEVLRDYNGTIILVTHDRYMMEKVCDKLLVFKDKKILRQECGINEYLNKLESKKKDNSKEDIMILENKISSTLGKLCLAPIGSDEYVKLDLEYKKLIGLLNQYKVKG